MVDFQARQTERQPTSRSRPMSAQAEKAGVVERKRSEPRATGFEARTAKHGNSAEIQKSNIKYLRYHITVHPGSRIVSVRVQSRERRWRGRRCSSVALVFDA
ncbi:uncharacterized protein UDID_17382 [Ustilago sp. UG-2017a]|nr:uncharacterized protein UDID_17382 [Ustilago sp. UG-2017a]